MSGNVVSTDSEALKVVAMLLKEFIVLRTRLDRIEAFVTSPGAELPMVLKELPSSVRLSADREREIR